MVTILQGNALALPLADSSVDLIVTSPPYFALRSYQDGCPDCSAHDKNTMRGYMERYCPQCGDIPNRNVCPKCNVTTLRTDAAKAAARTTADPNCLTCGGTGKGHYAGQIGSEATPVAFVDALIAATREMVRVLKPTGSIFVNLGDKYAQNAGQYGMGHANGSIAASKSDYHRDAGTDRSKGADYGGIRAKSLLGIPWRYALRCIDDLGLILRAEIIWSKPNGLPESVTDRVRRSHEQWFHMVKQPRYFSAVDEIREEQVSAAHHARYPQHELYADSRRTPATMTGAINGGLNPLGKLPGSVWSVPTQPLTVPPELGVDHFAAFPMEWPRRLILGWSPSGICTVCGEGRRPLADVGKTWAPRPGLVTALSNSHGQDGREGARPSSLATITGYACACPEPTAPTRPAVILDPFGGTGTVALMAKALGRIGVSVDMSSDYCRLAQWRTTDSGELARALQVEKPEPVSPDQLGLFDEVSA
jgi:DNA modification methylase